MSLLRLWRYRIRCDLVLDPDAGAVQWSPYSARVRTDPTKTLSESFRIAAERERQELLARLAECRERARHYQACLDEVEAEARESALLLRELEELLGIAPQLSLNELDGELRGARLREVALHVLRTRVGPTEEVHYRQWFQLVLAEGHRIAGKDPVATFLTQVSRLRDVERVGSRSGLYRLRAAA